MHVLAVSHACAVAMNQWLYVHLPRAGELEVELIAPTSWGSELRGKIAFERLPELTCPVHVLPPTWSGEDYRMHLALYRGAARVVEKVRPDLIYLDEEPYSLAAWQFTVLARRIGARCVFYSMQNLEKRLPPPFAQIERAVYRAAAGATALTGEVAQVLRARGFQKPIAVVPLSAELSAFHPMDVAVLRREHGLEAPVIGYLGRLSPGKGVDLLLTALKQLQDERIPFTGMIVGSGPSEAELRSQLTELGLRERVRVLPGVPHDQAPRFYNCLDVAVVPSRTMPHWKEQFGRVLVEALACGVPVVGSDSGAIPEVIASTGGGLIFPENDARRLADCLRLLLADAPFRRRLADTGRAATTALYSYEAVAAQLRRALLAFAGQRSRVETA
jgi:glycosyltransferase involved in cell wall biosynthesis